MIVHAPFQIAGRPILLLADGWFSPVEAKTAACVAMYHPGDVVAVLDASQSGRRVSEVLGYGGDAPVVGTIAEAIGLGPEVAIVGTAPMGGAIDGPLGEQVRACLEAGVDMVSGLHTFVGDDPALCAIAQASGARIWDVRRVEGETTVSTGKGCTTGAQVVLTVGTDCNVGKMTVTVELCRAVRERGVRASWAATGQTGMILRGRGVAVDRVIADFIGGAAESLVNFEGQHADIVFVEGQGAIQHPGYAGVTLALMYGVMPDHLVLVHTADRDHFKRLDVALPPLIDVIDMYERLMRPYKPARVVAVALNTSSLDDAGARNALAAVESETGRPATDVIRYGCDPILDAIR